MIKKYFKTILVISHLSLMGLGFAIGFGVGIYTLPILVADNNASLEEVNKVQNEFRYTGKFYKNQKGSTLVDWADGDLYISDKEIAFKGSIGPAPDLKIYLVKSFVEGNDAFLAIKDQALYVDDLKNFGNFKKNLPNGVNIDDYNTVVIWCERFKQFIGSAQYR